MSTGDPPWWTYMGAEITLDAIRKLVVRETFQNPDALEREKAVQEQVDALKARIDAMRAEIDRAIVSTELSALQARSDEADEVIICRINELMKVKAERDKLQAQLAGCEEDRIRHLCERNDAWDREKALQSRIDAMLVKIAEFHLPEAYAAVYIARSEYNERLDAIANAGVEK